MLYPSKNPPRIAKIQHTNTVDAVFPLNSFGRFKMPWSKRNKNGIDQNQKTQRKSIFFIPVFYLLDYIIFCIHEGPVHGIYMQHVNMGGVRTLKYFILF